jgi:hypothetical protein
MPQQICCMERGARRSKDLLLGKKEGKSWEAGKKNEARRRESLKVSQSHETLTIAVHAAKKREEIRQDV